MAGLYKPFVPSDIDIERQFFRPFSTNATNEAAYWIVKYCQDRGDWGPFFQEALEAFCTQLYADKPSLDDLIRAKHIKIDQRRGVVSLTPLFVAKCYVAAPAA